MVNYSDDNTESLESLYQRVLKKRYHISGLIISLAM